MGSISCRMCAAPLKIDENGFFAKCTYCGMNYTLPFEDETDEERMARAEPVLTRARMSLEDGRFEDAAANFERVLDIDPSFGEAWLGKGMAQLKVKAPADLRPIKRAAKQNYYIKKAVIFCRGDLKAELFDALGLKDRATLQNTSVSKWRENASKQRRSFLHEIKKRIFSDSPEYDKAAAEIEKKYSAEISAVRDRLEAVQADIDKVHEKLSKPLDMETVINSDQQLLALNNKKKLIEREITMLNRRMDSELEEAGKRFPGHRGKITSADYYKIAEKYPIPGCVPDINTGILDRIIDVLTSEYDYLSMAEIMESPAMAGTSERRVDGAIRKLLYERRIITKNIDGIDCYALSDMEGIETVATTLWQRK